MVEATAQLGGDIGESEEMQIERVEGGLRELAGNVWRREYHFRSDPRRRQRPICIVILCR